MKRECPDCGAEIQKVVMDLDTQEFSVRDYVPGDSIDTWACANPDCGACGGIQDLDW